MDIETIFFKKLLLLIAVLTILFQPLHAQKVVKVDLYVNDTIVDFTGKQKRAIAVNGQIPMPDLVFTQGDTAEIHVHNLMDEATSLHWHGVFLPIKEDGVPYLTQMPIAPHSTHIYRFPVIQNGTHWYHSHSGMQEQIGMYGNLIFLKKTDDPTFRKGIDDLPEIPIVLSEWTDYNPDNVHRMLHNATDWFAFKKNAVQSYREAIQANHFGTKIKNEWKRMLAMDVSDVYYDAILVNGQTDTQVSRIGSKELKAGQKVRLRISNGGASSYFWLQYARGKITVVANDGNDVEPVEVDRLIIAVSETYDVVITVPSDSMSHEFLVTTEDRTRSGSIYFGNGIKQLNQPLPRLSYFEGMKMMNDMMKMNGRLDDMGMNMSLNQMDMNVVMYNEITGKVADDDPNRYNANELGDIVTLNYAMLRSTVPTELPKVEVKTLRFELTGNMNRYVWSIDNKVVSETDYIKVKKGETLRIVLYNGSMMRHPMHLHGHDFRVLNGQGKYAPLKNVLDIMPMETDTIEFYANAEGDWFFHCHILYHMMSGMGRIFSYENQSPNPLIKNPNFARRKLYADDRNFHAMAMTDFANNGIDGEAMVQNTRWSLGTEWRLGFNDMHGYEVETHFGRYIGRMQWFIPFVGFDWRYRKMGMDEHEKNVFGQTNTKDLRSVFSLGFNYTLPMMLRFQAEVFTDRIVRLQLMREDIPVSKRMRASFMVNTDLEYMLGLHYIVSRIVSLRAHYDSDMGFGLGVSVGY